MYKHFEIELALLRLSKLSCCASGVMDYNENTNPALQEITADFSDIKCVTNAPIFPDSG